MTREEAIEYLNTLYMAFAVFPNQQISLGNVDEMKESVNMAINALEQEPSGDLISRQAVYEVLDSMLDDSSDNKRNQLVSLDSIADEIAELPPINPQEPKTGHWITKQNEVFKYYCDKCGTGDNLRTNYCPNCGTKMESEDKE